MLSELTESHSMSKMFAITYVFFNFHVEVLLVMLARCLVMYVSCLYLINCRHFVSQDAAPLEDTSVAGGPPA